jgi:hypothetical protein
MVSLSVVLLMFQMLSVTAENDFDTNVFGKILVLMSVFYFGSFAMFYKNQTNQTNRPFNDIRKYLFYIKCPFYIFSTVINNLLLCYILMRFNWMSYLEMASFVFLTNFIIVSLIFNFFLFSLNRTYVKVNTAFWIIVGLSLGAVHIDIMLDIPEIIYFNPLSGWFFIMAGNKGVNFFSALNLLLASCLFNYFFLKKMKTHMV